MNDKDSYYGILKGDAIQAEAYYTKSINKTEQQKFLEKLLGNVNFKSLKIADVACGGGTLSYHLRRVYSQTLNFICMIIMILLLILQDKLI